MLVLARRLFLGLLLIVATSAILLISDVGRRQRVGGGGRVVRVALLQYATSPLMEEGVRGIRDALTESGFIEGQTIEIRVYNAEGDMPTASAIAGEVTNGQFDLILTSGTPSMQAVANANRSGKTTHVFGIVADPFGAGVGISRENPLDHPKHMVGIGSFLPVAPVFQLAKQLYPDLQSVGVVWNPAESNSEAFTVAGRKICAELGIELLEANVDNSAGVFEAANSLVARGAQALWIGGDNTIAIAANSVLKAAKAAHIPTFSILTGNAVRGALFELGGDFFQIGRLTGALAAKILNGADPATIPVVNAVPEKFWVNKTALRGLRDPWKLPEAIIRRADVVIDETGIHERKGTTADESQGSGGAQRLLTKKWKLKIFSYTEAPAVEETVQGVLDGLREAALVKDSDYEIAYISAQGDIATASTMVDAAVADGTELLISLTTPMLQACLGRARGIPVVFTLVANPILAGAGRSDEDHLPNVTGNYVVSPFDEMMSILRECLPNVRRVGTLFAPAEVNSVFYKDKLIDSARRAGIEVELLGVSTSSEVADAALSLCSSNIDAVCQISDNLSGATFVPIARAAKRFKLPLFTFNTTQVRQGAAVVVARDYYDGGREAGLLAARVMRGESPATIPFQLTQKIKYAFNLNAIRAVGLNVPESLLKRADEIIGQ